MDIRPGMLVFYAEDLLGKVEDTEDTLIKMHDNETLEEFWVPHSAVDHVSDRVHLMASLEDLDQQGLLRRARRKGSQGS